MSISTEFLLLFITCYATTTIFNCLARNGKHYNGHHKTTAEKEDQRTPGKRDTVKKRCGYQVSRMEATGDEDGWK